MKNIIMTGLIIALLAIGHPALAERDWEYWSQGSISVPANNSVKFLVLPEWRFKNDMSDVYLFKLETGPSLKINEYLEIAPYYVYQEKKSAGHWDSSDLAYLDGTVKLSFKNFFDLKLSNRFRYQYDFDKKKTTLRNATKISKNFKIGKAEIAPYLSEEPFYDTASDKITEHRATVGVVSNLSKDISIGAGYMLNPKKGKTSWTYTNVLVTNLNIKF